MDMCKAIADMREDERIAGKVESILTLMDELRGDVSRELRETITSERDTDTLKRYLKLAASVDSVEEFVSRMA